ncbi:MAG: AraC family transcriptional regulator [Burkholderiales bacterium]|nr:AraC family transcriptional regulator [Burkholderiales bacterium]
MDTLSLILDDMRLQGSVFVYTHASAPWSLRLHTPGVAAFHIVTGGSAWLLRQGREPLALQAGDLVILPSGDDHRVQDRPGHEGPPTDLLPLISAPNRPDEPLRLGGGGTATTLVSGHTRFDAAMAAPLLAALPPLMHVRSDGDAPAPWLAIGLQFLAQEVSASRPAQQAIINRISDIMLIECIRDHVESLPEGSGNWLVALRDKALSTALGQMHREPARNWTVHELAGLACLSRSAFAERFTLALGRPPLAYLTQHRMRLAARQLAGSLQPISRIADSVGYASETAFSQAFKREYGCSPSIWREQQARARLPQAEPATQADESAADPLPPGRACG